MKSEVDPIESCVTTMLAELGEDPLREGLQKTPSRVARALRFLTSGYAQDPIEILNNAVFEESYDEMVLVKDIAFDSVCEHHLLPFMGKAHVAYLPNGRIAGLSKLARVVEILSRRPQVQERMTEELADLLMAELQPQGVGVILEATHTCMTIRGIRKPGSITTTSAMRGTFQSNSSTRAELMSLIFAGRA